LAASVDGGGPAVRKAELAQPDHQIITAVVVAIPVPAVRDAVAVAVLGVEEEGEVPGPADHLAGVVDAHCDVLRVGRRPRAEVDHVAVAPENGSAAGLSHHLAGGVDVAGDAPLDERPGAVIRSLTPLRSSSRYQQSGAPSWLVSSGVMRKAARNW